MIPNEQLGQAYSSTCTFVLDIKFRSLLPVATFDYPSSFLAGADGEEAQVEKVNCAAAAAAAGAVRVHASTAADDDAAAAAGQYDASAGADSSI